jgi:hypothetical protein
MSKSVSNDALWEKLSEIEEKINLYLKEQKVTVPAHEQVDITPELKAGKAEILAEIDIKSSLLGTHSQSHFDANRQNIIALDENIRRILNIVSHIRKQQRETAEQADFNNIEQSIDNKSYFNFRFFKVKKTSFVMTILGILVFIFTLFCMKQQNDHSLLMDEYYRQGIELREMQKKVDSLRNIEKPIIKKK